MKVLHITPHLGGGVGKAHATLSKCLDDPVQQTFVLLEPPRDSTYVNQLQDQGVSTHWNVSLSDLASLCAKADIVQFEFWNHPRLFECLARCPFPAMRAVFWCHISGISAPIVHPALIEQAQRFVFTTSASLQVPHIRKACDRQHSSCHVIESAFGFQDPADVTRPTGSKPSIAYLGTVDTVKMHPGFFNVIDALPMDDGHVDVWGDYDPAGAIGACLAQMQHSHRIHLHGFTNSPQRALQSAHIFFYPLQPNHYGTAENALVEAMSLGLVPVVLNNPAEAAIVRNGETGFIADSLDDCISILSRLLESPALVDNVGRQAQSFATQQRTPERAGVKFVELWSGLAPEPRGPFDFRSAIGTTPWDWFLATQMLPGQTAPSESIDLTGPTRSKGTLAHFKATFPDMLQEGDAAEPSAATHGVQPLVLEKQDD